MNTKLCRTCRKSGQNFVDIFRTAGLKYKIETCLPIFVSQHCLLPDTLCPECLISIENFYAFTKSCLQNLIILETQLDIQESCLKAKRKKDKSCQVSLLLPNENKCVQTEDYLNVLLGEKKDFQPFNAEFPLTNNFFNTQRSHSTGLVGYDINSEDNSSDVYDDNDSQCGQVVFGEKLQSLKVINNIVDNIIASKGSVSHNYEKSLISAISEQCFINEITERKNSQKRKSESFEATSPKVCKVETGHKRKCTKPKKLEKSFSNNSQTNEKQYEVAEIKKEKVDFEFGQENCRDVDRNSESAVDYHEDEHKGILHTLPQSCLLCNAQLIGPNSLADHFMTVHTREANHPNVESSSGESCNEKKKRSIPSLVKISDLKRSESFEDSPVSDHQTEDDTTHHRNITCPNCPTEFSTKPELFVHLQLNHSEISIFLCGICLKQTNSASNLSAHVSTCLNARPATTRYFCQVCCFGEDNYRSMESHVLVHNFLWKSCQKEIRNFDPENYIQKNHNFVANCASPIKNFSCLECSKSDFDTFKKFSVHRRNVHSIFHCDLCNKFYGRNSHLWKHVNRLHKNHPSITCQVCFKTSASKYHLAQHFAKIHQAKTVVVKKEEPLEDVGERPGKAEDMDFGNARSTLRKQDSTEQENINTSCDENSLNQSSQSENDSMDPNDAPKEIDPTHDLYTNILTNYTPPKNEGDYKCPKCSKGFHKRVLLRKHKKNCRPKLQKDLLTRCKTCARIFKDRQSLAKHLINYHSDYVCEICNEKVPSKCEIVGHIRFQHPSSHLICSVCENILRCKKDLSEHLADHENSFVCQFCGDALASKVKLKMHILSLHRKILSLSCGICLKLFETQQVLRSHVTLVHKHRLVPLISCPVCGKNYGSKWKTFDHVNKSHGRFFKACKICLEIYETESQLETHMSTAHPNQQVPLNMASKINPAAILRSPIKIEQEHLYKNENRFDTDSEGNTEETENSQTSESEEDENDTPPPVAELEKPCVEKLQGFATQENKMSLLEKRLLGKAFTQTNMTLEKNVGGNSYKLCLANNTNKLTGEYTKEKSASPKTKGDDDSHFAMKKSDYGHHSKRTVYENSNDPSFCEICYKTWPAKKHLWQHYIRCHKRVAAMVCGICLKTNNDYESLQTHLRETHPTLLHGQGFGSNFICRICGRYHNASSKLRLHMVIHEKFDWTLLEKFPPILKSNMKSITKENGTQFKGTGYNGIEDYAKCEPKKAKKEMDMLNTNEEMYDDMIEQVEESTTSTDVEAVNKTQDSSINSDNTTTTYTSPNINKPQKDPVQDVEQRLSFSNLLQTLKNHNQFQVLNHIQQNSPSKSMIANQLDTDVRMSDITKSTNQIRAQSVIRLRQGGEIVSAENIASNKVHVKIESLKHSYLSEDTSSSISDSERDGDANSQNSRNGPTTEREDDSVEESAVNDGQYYNRIVFGPKPEELDSAIKSISDHCTEPQAKTEYGDFNESVQQGNCLNETEIESAVGSIL